MKGARPFVVQIKNLAYFAGLTFAGTSTFSMSRSICVPESSFTLSVFETITGPGVLGLGASTQTQAFQSENALWRADAHRRTAGSNFQHSTGTFGMS